MKSKQETLQPLTIYGNTLTPRSRREMSDLQYYSKLPPIPPESAASQNVGDVDASTDVNQELEGDITLDLGDIDVSCVTERNGHDVSYIGEEDEGDQHHTVDIHTSTNTTENSGYPENYVGASVSTGLDPSPRSGYQNPALLNGALSTINDPKDFQEAKVLSTLSEIENSERVIADLQNEDSFKNVADCRVEVKASDINQPSGVNEDSHHRTLPGIKTKQPKAITELPEDELAVSIEGTDPIRTEFDEVKSTPTERTTVKQPDDTNTGKITVTVTAPSFDIEDFSKNDDVLIKVDDVSSMADDVSAANDDSRKHDDVVTKNNDVSLILDDTDNESENSCDDECVYNTDVLDYDDDDDVNLMTIEEQEEQRLWDLEFDKRKEQIVLDQLKIETRRKDFQSKLNNLTDRWNGIEARLENRQVEKRHQLYEQLQQLVTLHKRS